MSRALAVALLLLLFGCGGAEPLRLGISLGEEGRRASRIAAAEINAAGGVDGRPLELRFASHGEAIQAQPAIAAADGFARDASIIAVVGHGNSSSSLAASQIYNSHGLPHIAPTTTAPLFTRAGPFSYRLVPDDRGQGKFLARQALAGGQHPRVAIMYVNDDYGRALFDEVRRELGRLGVEVVYEAPFLEAAAASQFEGTFPALAKSPPGLLFWLGRSGNLTPILSPLRAAFPDLTIIGSDGMETPDIYETPSYVGVRVVRFFDPRPEDGRLDRFRDPQRGERVPVTTEAVMAYDAVTLLAAALRSGARSREEVRDYLDSLGRSRPPFEGISGPISFDENGDVSRPYHLAIVTAAGAETVRSE